MGMLTKKDSFGFKHLRKPSGEHLFWFGLVCGVVLTISMLVSHGCADTNPINVAEASTLKFNVDTKVIANLGDLPHADEVLNPGGAFNDTARDNIKEPPVVIDPVPLPETKFVKYAFRMVPIEKRRRLATTYSKWDSPAERKGIYSNQRFAAYLNLYQRRIRDKHYGVALCLLDADYHNRIVQMPDGTWTHKFRVHVPAYNRGEKPKNMETSDKRDSFIGSNLTAQILAIADCKWFSVPRDRMSHKGDKKNHNGKCDYCVDDQCIDVLHTGCPAIAKRNQKRWMENHQAYMDVEFWEVACFAIFDNGVERQVRLREAYGVIEKRKGRDVVVIHEVPGGGFVK